MDNSDELMKEIVSEILLGHSSLLNEIDLHSQSFHDKKNVFHFICIKGKHLCRLFNNEQNTMIRHSKTKQILFKNE